MCSSAAVSKEENLENSETEVCVCTIDQNLTLC